MSLIWQKNSISSLFCPKVIVKSQHHMYIVNVINSLSKNDVNKVKLVLRKKSFTFLILLIFLLQWISDILSVTCVCLNIVGPLYIYIVYRLLHSLFHTVLHAFNKITHYTVNSYILHSGFPLVDKCCIKAHNMHTTVYAAENSQSR